MKILCLSISILLFPTFASAQGLLAVPEKHLYGFIDSSGQVVIEPEFPNPGRFANGLAAVRKNGLYGYIDTGGRWVIKPEYEYAEAFSDGLAVVYNNATPLFIDKGNQRFAEGVYKEIAGFTNKRAIVTARSNKKGVINSRGELLIDTLYEGIREIRRGYYHASSSYPDTATGLNRRISVSWLMDSTGSIFIPVQENEMVQRTTEDYIQLVATDEHNRSKIKVVDFQGEVLLQRSLGEYESVSSTFNNGLAKVYLYDTSGTDRYDYNSRYVGFMDLKGNLVINNPKYQNGSAFSSNRAFIELRQERPRVYVIDPEGQVLNDQPFDHYEEFRDGYAFVRVNRKWGVIDTNANFVYPPAFDRVIHLGKDYFAFTQSDGDTAGNCRWCYGIASYKGRVIAAPLLQKVYSGFEDGLLLGKIDDRLCYVNRMGETVWHESEIEGKELMPLNIDYMNRGYFRAYSAPLRTDLGGFASSKNYAKKFKGEDFDKDSLRIEVLDAGTAAFAEEFQGRKVLVANTTGDTINFDAQDSRLRMKVQARDASGKWSDIEYLPQSWCGNSYHMLVLNPGEYWEFSTPDYQGNLKTEFRIELEYIHPEESEGKRWNRKHLKIFSNEYEGSVNPSQFWREPGYVPQGIMDPYMN